jgi:hypothetical protein
MSKSKTVADSRPQAFVVSSGCVASKLEDMGTAAGSRETAAVRFGPERILLSEVEEGMLKKEVNAGLLCGRCGGNGPFRKNCPGDRGGSSCSLSVSSKCSGEGVSRAAKTGRDEEGAAATLAAFREDELDVADDRGRVHVFLSCASDGVAFHIDDICGHEPATSAAASVQKVEESCEETATVEPTEGECAVMHASVVDDADDVSAGRIASDQSATAAALESEFDQLFAGRIASNQSAAAAALESVFDQLFAGRIASDQSATAAELECLVDREFAGRVAALGRYATAAVPERVLNESFAGRDALENYANAAELEHKIVNVFDVAVVSAGCVAWMNSTDAAELEHAINAFEVTVASTRRMASVIRTLVPRRCRDLLPPANHDRTVEGVGEECCGLSILPAVVQIA